MGKINFYNTLSRKKEPFSSIEENHAKIYTCGPTVYNYVHIGNLRTFMFEDLLVRYLRFKGYTVTQVMNLTDVDDKTIKGSQKENISLNDYTKKYKEAFFEDIKTLNISKAQNYPAATEHINEMVLMVKTLLEKGFAYKADDNSIYFSIKKFKEYGKLSGMKAEDLKVGGGGRVNADEYSKDEARDFVLWKAYDEDDKDVYWETELGKGRPGWHLECSAMSRKYLGNHFDIHCGGIDNAFPHHENEIAQSEAANGEKFVNYWMHSAFLQINSEKMAKSKGNFFTLRELLEKGYDAKVIRYALLSTHYRQPLNFSSDLLKQSQSALNRLQEFISNLKAVSKETDDLTDFDSLIKESRENFISFMDDDLNISPALASIFDFIRKSNTLINKMSKNNALSALGFLKELNGVFGFLDFDDEMLEDEISTLIEQRNQARLEKNYKKADSIRDLLLEKGILLKDGKEGTRWTKV